MNDPAHAAKTPEQRARREAFLQSLQSSVQQAVALKVKIAFGFDASSPDHQGKNAYEFVAMTRLGIPPLEALRAATVNAAELMGWQDRVGTIEPGKYADLIAVNGDPLNNVAVLQDVRFVMKGGVVVTRFH